MENTPAYDPNSSIFDEVTPAFTYASVGQRFLDYIIDLVVIYAIQYIIYYFLGTVQGLTGWNIAQYFVGSGMPFLNRILLSYTLNFLYYLIMEGSSGRSVGKLVTGVKVVQEDGVSPITWRQAALRSLVRMVPFEPFSAFSGYPWHDKWTKTYVIKSR